MAFWYFSQPSKIDWSPSDNIGSNFEELNTNGWWQRALYDDLTLSFGVGGSNSTKIKIILEGLGAYLPFPPVDKFQMASFSVAVKPGYSLGLVKNIEYDMPDGCTVVLYDASNNTFSEAQSIVYTNSTSITTVTSYRLYIANNALMARDIRNYHTCKIHLRRFQ